MSTPNFTWIPAYEAIADALLERKYNRNEVLELFKEITGDDERTAVDPFTFFTAFNRGIVEVDRLDAIELIMHRFGVDAPMPQDFTGIPSANMEAWQYFDATPESIDDCWSLFEVALKLAEPGEKDENTYEEFCELFDKIHKQENITKARLTRTLYWMRPNKYLPFGEKAREYIHAQYGVNTPIMMRGARYLRLISEMNAVSEEPFYEVAAHAYQAADSASWWPDVRDYDPDMSIHQWMVLLEDKELTSDEMLRVLRFIRDKGGDFTTDDLAHKYMHDREYYSNLIRAYSRNVARKMDRANFKGSWWPIMFLGNNGGAVGGGAYVFRLRPEVIDALNAIDGKDA